MATISLDSIQAATRKAHRLATASDKPRIEKALVLLGLGNVHRVDRTTFRVVSQSEPLTDYTVCPGTCECKGAQFRPKAVCSHRWSVNLLVWAERIEAHRSEAEAFPLLSAEERAKLMALKSRVEVGV